MGWTKLNSPSIKTIRMMALMPISALFIIFDLVVHNPTHPETNNNLALLDVASGHFSRLEYASQGTLPGSLIAEFAHIAREHVRDVQRANELCGKKDDDDNNNNNNNNSHRNRNRAAPTRTSVDSNRRNQTETSNRSHVLDPVPFANRVVQSPSRTQSLSLGQGSFTAAISQTQVIGRTSVAPPTPASVSLTTVSPEIQQQQQQPQNQHSTYQSRQHPFVALSPMYNGAGGAGAGTGTESLFFPLVDDPSYCYIPEEEVDEEVQRLLGIDVMDLFDVANPAASGAGGI
jgi:hypothetical protein